MDPHAHPGPVASCLRRAPARVRGRVALAARRALVAGAARAARGRLRAAHAAAARPRPDRALQGLPAPQAQDAGLRRARGRSLPHAADPHARGDPDLAHGRPGAAPSTRTSPRRSGSATTSATRPSATSARTCSTLPARALRTGAFATTSTRCASSTSSSSTATGLNLCDDVRDGIVRHSGRAPLPRTLEGRIVRLVDRVAYINHDIDDALRAGVLREEELPGRADRGARRHGLAPHRRARARPRRALRGRRRHRPGRGGRAPPWTRCGPSCSTTSTSGRSPRREHAKIERVVRTLFDHYVAEPDRIPDGGGVAGRRPAPARHRLAGRDDRPLLHPRLRGAVRAGGVRGLGWTGSGALHRRLPRPGPRRGRHGRPRRLARRAAPGGRQPLRGPVPVPRRAHAVVRDQPRREALLLLRLRRGRRRAQVRPGDRGGRLRRRAGVPRRPLRRRARAGRGGSGGGRSAAPSASACYELLERTAAFYVRYLWDSARGRGRARVPGRARPRRGRRCASSASATRRARGTRCCSPRARPGFSDRELVDGRARAAGEGGGAHLRPLPPADHVPALRPARARARASARAPWAPTRSRST